MDKPIAIDAFCGAGGLSLGLYWSGFDIRMGFDFDEKAISTYNGYFSHKGYHKRIEDLDGKELRKLAGIKEDQKISLLAGGPPCQGFSVQRRGSDHDVRNELVLEYFRLVDDLKPDFFLVENVVGIKGSRGKKYIELLCSSAKALGYHTHIDTLDAVGFGVPQHRKRVFMVGEKLIGEKTFFSFPKPTHDEDNWITVGEALKGLPEPPDDCGEHLDWPNHRKERLTDINRIRISYVPEGGGREYIPEELQLSCHKNKSADLIGHRYVYGRLDSRKPAGTITARFDSFTRGKFAHPFKDRSITLREGARLQSFPDDFVFVGNKVEIARQIGNAVPPLLAKAVGFAIKEAIEKRVKNQMCDLSVK